MASPEIQYVYEPAPIPGRLNEDSYLVIADEHIITVLVADGASQRLPIHKIEALIQKYPTPVTPAGYASHLIRDTVRAGVRGASPRDLLLAANQTLGRHLTEIYGALDAAAFLKHEPHLDALREDPRLIRLALPVSVATLVQIDLARNQLQYAHAGDTALCLFLKDGAVRQPTRDQMGPYDQAALATARSVQTAKQLPHLRDVVNDPDVIAANRHNGLYHNYVDEHGQTQSDVGVGVINGLPQLADYIETGTVDLTQVAGCLVCSDGFIWPAAWDEEPAAEQARWRHMADIIQREGMRGYFAQLRAAESTDATLDRYPRFKVHDDATGVFVSF
jgi:hypothetical protein